MNRLFLLIALVLLCSQSVKTMETPHSPNSPSGSISGKVTNQNGEPMPGATVVIEHKAVGTYCNAKGNFFIKYAPVGEHVIIASMVGYKPSKHTINISKDDTTFLDLKIEQGSFNTGTIVVTATSTPHMLEDSPIHTEVISQKTIETKQANNLADALEGHTGIMVENNCGNCNFTQVRINGLDGKYSEILIDGDPVFSTLAGVYGLEQIPEDMINNIEIVKGGGSSLYGGGAVAGIINVITRRPVANRLKVSYLANAMVGHGDDERAKNFKGDNAMDHDISAIAEFISNDGSAGGFVFGSMRNRNQMDFNGDGFSELGLIKQESFGINTYFDISRNQELTVNYHHIHEERRGGDSFGKPMHEADVAEGTETWRNGGKIAYNHVINSMIRYKAYYSFGLTERNSYYGGTGGDNSDEGRLAALDAYGRTHNPLHLMGLRSHIEFDGQIITFGADYKNESLVDASIRNNHNNFDENYTNIGVYAQDNMHFFKDESLEFVVGLRADKHSELEHFIISPRVSAKYALDYGFNLRASYSSGFKAPQIFDEDLHIESLEGKQRIILNEDGLKEERSNSFSAGFEYNGMIASMQVFFNTTAFYTNLANAFDSEFNYEDENFYVYKRINAGKAEVTGIEMNAGLSPLDGFEIRMGMNYKNAEYGKPNPDYGDQEGARKLERTPDLSGNLTIDYELTADLSANLMVKYMGPAYLPHESLIDKETGIMPLVRTDSYTILDLGVQYKFALQEWTLVKLSLGVKNLLNSYQEDLDWGISRDPSYLYGPSLPRTVYVGFDLEL